MPEVVENPMANDSCWRNMENQEEIEEIEEIREKLNGSGYSEIGTGIFVPLEKAFLYAIERCLSNEEDFKEFVETVVEWFYSGNWVKEERDGKNIFTGK